MAFILDGKYGKFEVCIKIKGDTSCRYKHEIDSTFKGLSASYKRILIPVDAKKNIGTGEYIVELTSLTDSSGMIMAAVELEEGNNTSMISREIKAGLAITDHLPHRNNSAYYHFHVPKGTAKDGLTSLRVHLTPIKGEFILTLNSDGTKPSPEKNVWSSFSDEITVTAEDPAFVDDAEYVVGVHPLILSEEQDYQY